MLAALSGGSLATAGVAMAGDLIVLGPDTATLSGVNVFNQVYIGEGATVRLAGDTAIVANDVYFAGGSSLRTCFVEGGGDNGCAAGRNLTIKSNGELNVGSGISLVGGSGTPRPGGSLILQGTSVSVNGGIDTSGSMGGPSGYVTVSSPGPVNLSSSPTQASVNAPAAPVSIHGASVALSGDLNTAGADVSFPSGGSVDVAATAGPLTIRGNVLASGRDNPAGSAAPVSLRGTDVRVGRIDASAGSSTTGPPGISGTVSVVGSSSVTISDFIDTRGASGASTTNASAGSNVGISSPGQVIAGTIFASGANGDGTGVPSVAGNIAVSGGAVATGQLWANGGSRTGGAGGPGARGSVVQVTSAGPLSVDEIEANGGNSVATGVPGAQGGEIDLTGDGVFTSELRTTPGTSTGNSPGGFAGPIHVNGKSFVTILGGGVFANGASATGAATNPPDYGGAGGVVTIHAAAGPLSLASTIRTSGGNAGAAPGGVRGGVGGPGGAVELVGTPIDPIAGISTDGGDGGQSSSPELQGPGGPGGVVHAWSETNIFGGLRSISTAGGAGAPPGVDGAQLLDSGPTGLSVDATGRISFTSQSPAAQGFNILRSIGGAAPTLVLTTLGTSALTVPATAVCAPVTYQVLAFQNAVGWASPATTPVAWTRQPSSKQHCTDAPALSHDKKVILKQSNLKKRKGAMSFVVQTNGIGNISATATSKGVKKPLATATIPIAKAGSLTITLKLDLKAKLKFKKVKGRQVARVSVKLVAAAPAGSSKTSITIPVEVRK